MCQDVVKESVTAAMPKFLGRFWFTEQKSIKTIPQTGLAWSNRIGDAKFMERIIKTSLNELIK